MKISKTLMMAAAALALTTSAALAEGNTTSGNEASGSADQSYNSDQNNSTSGAAGSNDMSGASGAQANANMDRDTVQEVQTSLNNEGYNVSTDGIWGPQTSSAIRQFQQANGLSATGTLDNETLAALEVDTGM